MRRSRGEQDISLPGSLVVTWSRPDTGGVAVRRSLTGGAHLLPVVFVSLLGACTSYQSRPLPEQSDLVNDITAVQVEETTFPIAALQSHPFNPADGLDWIEVSMLAVANNPDLKAQRTTRRAAAAQVYAAGLLPDPQLVADISHPISGGSDTVNGFGLGLKYNLLALVTRGAGLEASRARQTRIDLELLWQEWQTIQQARLLTVKMLGESRRLQRLDTARSRYRARYQRAQRLMEQGQQTLDAAGSDFSAWLDTTTRFNRAQQNYSRLSHELHSLLGLDSAVTLPLAGTMAPVLMEPAVVNKALSQLPRRRPDLLALQAGYRSQEQQVRKAILEQFPVLDAGITRTRDTDNIDAVAFGVTLNLPLFSGNRGVIAVERATRERLRAEYQSRLDLTRGEVARLLDQQRLLLRQRDFLQQQLPALTILNQAAHKAYDRGDLHSLDLLNLDTTLLDKRLELIGQEQTLQEVRIALDTLLAWPVTEE